MAIQTLHFTLPAHGTVNPTEPHLPGRSTQAGNYCFGIQANKLELFSNAGPLPPNVETDLYKVAEFVRTHLADLSSLDKSSPLSPVNYLLLDPMQTLIKEHNDRVDNSVAVRVLMVFLLILTFGIYNYKNNLIIAPIGTAPNTTIPNTAIPQKRPIDKTITESHRYAVRDATNRLLHQHLANRKSPYLSEARHVCLYAGGNFSDHVGSELLPTFDVLQVPCFMDYDEKWQPRNGEKKCFFIHHVAAPDLQSKDCVEFNNGKGELVEGLYLERMHQLFKNTLTAQVASGVKEVVWVPLGMGAFLRNLEKKYPKYKDQEAYLNLRKKLMDIFLGAVSERPGLHIHFCLVSDGADAANKTAFEAVFDDPTTHPNLKKQVTVHIDEDATQIAQDLANANGAYSASLMNAANRDRIGNHWYAKGALSAIDENFHRRSSMAAYYAARLNGYNPNDRTFLPGGHAVLENRIKRIGLN